MHLGNHIFIRNKIKKKNQTEESSYHMIDPASTSFSDDPIEQNRKVFQPHIQQTCQKKGHPNLTDT